MVIPDNAMCGVINGCTGWLRGRAGVWHRQAGYYLLQCAAFYSPASFGADLGRGQVPACECQHGLCWGSAAGGALPPAPQPCFCGPHC